MTEKFLPNVTEMPEFKLWLDEYVKRFKKCVEELEDE